VEGAAGVGKTRLLAEIRERAEQGDILALTARASQIERTFAFGVVRQLFEPHLLALREDERRALLSGQAGAAVRPLGLVNRSQRRVGSDVEYAALNGLYWLCVNLAQRSPVALFIDDAHWADELSLKWIAFATARLHHISVLMAITARTSEPGVDTPGLPELARLDHTRTLAPQPLSIDAVERLLQETCGQRPEAGFARSCHRATGGNPFLLDELIEQIHQRGIVLTDANAALVPDLGSAGVAHEVLSRVERLGADAIGLTRATAVLGDGARLADAADLAGVAQNHALAAAGDLVDAGVLAIGPDLTFSHPLMRAAVYDSIPGASRFAGHARAARLLADRDAPPQAVSAHLLRVSAPGGRWVVSHLRAAAREACAQGSPRDAVRYLRRALEEPFEDATTAQVLVELGTAEHHANDSAAIEHLQRALSLLDAPAQLAAAGLTLARAVWSEGMISEAVSLLEELIDGLGEHLAAPLEAELIAIARLHPQTRAVGLERSARIDASLLRRDRLLLANAAFDQAVSAQRTAAEITAMATEALGNDTFLDEHGSENTIFHLAAWALAQADRFEEAERALQAALALARAEGSVVGFARALNFLADIRFRHGRLRDAEADARASLDHLTPVRAPLAVAFLIGILLERGELDEAEQVLERFGLAGDVPPTILCTFVLERRGRLRLAQARVDDALTDLLLCEQRSLEWGALNPAFLPWRSSTALALRRAGQIDRAKELTVAEVAIARKFGAPRAVGAALRVRASTADRDDALELLDEAVGVLRRSSAALELAHSLVDLGTALTSRGQRDAARAQLREGLHLAQQCGAATLARRARIELRAAGGRPIEPIETGLGALTAGEFRIATMAADGMTNRDIAQALFLTPKTVEWHLGQIYRKLGLHSRMHLPEALNPARDGARPDPHERIGGMAPSGMAR
jgi:DNA-binding CsgD family transcriptional regulator